MNDTIFSQIDFGPLKEFIDDDNITIISFCNDGQIHLTSLDKGCYSIERPDINNTLVERLAFQCSSVMGKTFNMAHPLLDAESAELHLNFIHDSIATNGIACTIRKIPAKIRLNKEKILNEKYVTEELLNFLLTCVKAHSNIIVSGESSSGKTELVKYLASHIEENEKIITIEDTLEFHLDKIFPHRDIVAMKTNEITGYSDALMAAICQDPRWIILKEINTFETVCALRNIVSKGHNVLSTINSDSAKNIPARMYSLLETKEDSEQFLNTIHRYIQLGIHVRSFMNKESGKYQREIAEVCEFYVSDDNKASSNIIYEKTLDGTITYNNPTNYLKNYLASQGVELKDEIFSSKEDKPKETIDSL